MDISKLLFVYSEQLKNLISLSEIVKEKKAALVSAKHSEFELLISREEKALMAVQSIEKQRRQLASEIITETFPLLAGKTGVKLSRILNGLISPADLNKLIKLENELREGIVKLNEENAQNLFLIQHMRTFYNGAVQALMGKSNTSLIDRRA